MKPKKAASWEKIAELMQLMTRYRQAEWKCGFPPFDSLPSEELERVVDEWCLVLSYDPMMRIDPPVEVKQWILARVLSMEASAKELAARGDMPAPELDATTLQQCLIGEWHGALRDRWNMMVTLDLQDGTA